MNLLLYLRDIFACGAAVFFYGLLMSVPPKPLIPAAISGSAAYLLYRILYLESGHELLGYLAASLFVAAVSEILARKYKMPATIFVMPGIIPLVPGVGLYRSMLCLVQNDIDGFLAAGVRTLFISGIIAVAVAVTNAAARHIPRRDKQASDSAHPAP